MYLFAIDDKILYFGAFKVDKERLIYILKGYEVKLNGYATKISVALRQSDGDIIAGLRNVSWPKLGFLFC